MDEGESSPVPRNRNDSPRFAAVRQAVIEIGFIVFLFYSNLLMGEFTRGKGQGKSLLVALHNIFAGTNFFIALICAFIGYVVFEHLRREL